MYEYILLLAGLSVLLVGGDLLVRGAVGFAEKLSIPPLIIGLTIVSLGTSAPELFVSVKAALDGVGGLAIGNVVGSNIANVLLVLGLPALIHATCCQEEGISRNMLVMLGLTVVFMGMMLKGSLERYDGVILLTLLVLFLWDQFRSAKSARSSAAAELDYHDEVPAIPTRMHVVAISLIAGLMMLPFGAKLIVDSGTHIAMTWNVPEEIIGLSIIAIGTSLPELAASLMAVMRGNASVALGNIVGSNIFNIAAIMGTTALIKPIDVGAHIIQVDMWVMLGVSVLLALLAHYHKTIATAGGLAMVAGYTIYIVLAFI